MTKSVVDYLQDILEQTADVESFVLDGYEWFMADRKTQNAVIRAYEVIGEIVKRLPNDLLVTQPQVNWKNIKGFRDYLIHNYDGVDLAYVWKAVEDLPNLKTATLSLLEELQK